MLLLIDNYDSFTYNLVQRLGEMDPNIDLEVHRNDKIGVDAVIRRSTANGDGFLRYYGDLGNRQIAETLGIKPGTVAATIHQAQEHLRNRLRVAVDD